MAGGASWMLTQIGKVLATTTQVNLFAPWFVARSHIIDGFLPIVATIFLVVAVVQALLRQEAALLFRMVLVNLPASIVLASVAVELASLGLSVSDQLSSGMSAGSGAQIQQVMEHLSSAVVKLTETASTIPSFITALLGLIVVLSSLALWVELIIRASAIYVVVAFWPLALLTLVWPGISAWARRLSETLVALILSKLVIVVVLSLGVGALSQGSAGGVASILVGLAMVILAAFSPFALLRLIPMIEAGATAHLQGLRQHAQQVVHHGSARNAVNFAMNRLTTPMVPPLAMATTGPPPRVGVHLTSDPMAGSAVMRAQTNPPRPARGPGLEIGRDAMGPVIQPRRVLRDDD